MLTNVRCNPWYLLRDMQGEMKQVLDRRLTSDSDIRDVGISQWSPRVDIEEQENKIIMTADLPGVEPREIEISIDNQVLMIKGERKLERKVNEENYSRVERFSGTFYRRFTLPDYVDGEKIQAESKHGVLKIILLKKARHVPKKIEVQEGG